MYKTPLDFEDQNLEKKDFSPMIEVQEIMQKLKWLAMFFYSNLGASWVLDLGYINAFAI